MKDTRVIRLCGGCSSSDAYQALPRVFKGKGLRADKRCFGCGVVTFTLVYYRRQATHPWLTFLTYFLVGLGLAMTAHCAGLTWTFFTRDLVTMPVRERGDFLPLDKPQEVQ